MDDFSNKLNAALRLMAGVLETHAKPVVLCSFGKDSMVLLHLVRQMRSNIPVLFHREPFMPRKYAFANRIIQEWDLTVYDYAPNSVAVVKVGDEIEIMNHYQNGWLGDQPTFTYLPTGIVPPVEGQPFLCGKVDLLEKPTGGFSWPWDLGFIGHKGTDADAINGPIPLRVDLVQTPNGCDMAYPLRHFTDADIWEYHRRFNVPVHGTRYDVNNGYREFADKRDNPDYFECCTKCFDRDQPAVVRCPKTGLEINNISAFVKYEEPFKREYFAQEG